MLKKSIVLLSVLFVSVGFSRCPSGTTAKISCKPNPQPGDMPIVTSIADSIQICVDSDDASVQYIVLAADGTSTASIVDVSKRIGAIVYSPVDEDAKGLQFVVGTSRANSSVTGTLYAPFFEGTGHATFSCKRK